MDVAVEQLQRDRQKDQPDENHSPRQPDQVGDEEGIPDQEEEIERNEVGRAGHERKRGRVGERAERPQGRRVRMERIDVPVRERVEPDHAVEVRSPRHDQHQPRKDEVAEDRGLAVDRQTSPDTRTQGRGGLGGH